MSYEQPTAQSFVGLDQNTSWPGPVQMAEYFFITCLFAV